jgi:parallel beta-helix repeat protein
VIVAVGTYYENILWPNTQAILLTSGGSSETIIDGEHQGSVITIDVELDTSTIINGFTIQNGEAWNGGGIRIESSNPKLIDMIVRYNKTVWGDGVYGGGIYCLNSNPILKNIVIFNNTCDGGDGEGFGGGLACIKSSPILFDVYVIENILFSWTMAGGGGGIYLGNHSNPIFNNVTISGNKAFGDAGGGICCDSSSPALINVNIIGNISQWGGGISVSNSNPELELCSISENVAIDVGGGIVCWGNSNPTIYECIISNNSGDGVYSYSNPEINYCIIKGNNGYGIFNNDSTIIINAENNWWGDATGPSGFGPGTGDSVSQWVDYEPWLGGVSEINERLFNFMPKDYILFQNFPNPFNPTTTIKYSIPQTSKVVIKVFDIQGNEIEILVNEEKSAGTYEVEFSTSSLPSSVSAKGGYASGVYFYRLQAGVFVETKKMVLLR